MSSEVAHGAAGHSLAEKSKPVEYVAPGKPEERQTTVYTYTNTPEPAPVAPPVKPAQNPRHSSKESGHMTPPDVVEKARLVLGGFDLDPFSSEEANRAIRAANFFSEFGFDLEWYGKVFCNPPGGKERGRSNQKRAWFKLAEEYMTQGYVSSAFFVCFSVELLQTTQIKTPEGLPLPLDFPICYPKRRIAYVAPGGKVGKSPPHSSCLILLPERTPTGAWDVSMLARFRQVFSDVGRVVVPQTRMEVGDLRPEETKGICTCPAASEYDPPCPEHGVRPIGMRGDGSYLPPEYAR